MRNRYIDLLRAAAILRVIVYHLFGWPWLTILLPAMGVMFALAGSLTAASLDKRDAAKVVTSRLRRLLPPLWALAAVAVPAMYLVGWHDDELGLHRLAYWLVPIGDPPGNTWGTDLWEPLWYIRGYVWFILLSPLLYGLWKRVGWLALAAPLGLLAALHWTGVELYGAGDAIAWDAATYGACWIAGFAHHDGRLARLRPWVLAVAVAGLGAAAMMYLQRHPGENGPDLNDIPEAQALWSLAFVLLALRVQPPMGWFGRVKGLAAAVRVLNARAVTIYLWHNPAIALAFPVLTVLALDDLGRLNGPVDLVTSLALTVAATAAFGWVEDLAARRRPRLWPGDGAAAAPRVPKQHWTHGPAASPDFLRRLAAAAPACAAPDVPRPVSATAVVPVSRTPAPGPVVASAAVPVAAPAAVPVAAVLDEPTAPHTGLLGGAASAAVDRDRRGGLAGPNAGSWFVGTQRTPGDDGGRAGLRDGQDGWTDGDARWRSGTHRAEADR